MAHALFATLAFILASTSRSAPPPVEAFAALPTITDVNLSPSGAEIAWADRSSVEAYVVIVDLASNSVKHRISIGTDYKLRDLAWSDDDTLLITLSQTHRDNVPGGHKREIWRTLAIDFASGKGHALLMTSGARQLVTGAELLAWHTAKPKTVIMTTLDFDANVFRKEVGSRIASTRGQSGWTVNLYEVDTLTGKGKVIEQGSAYTEAWVVDKGGRCIARSDWNPAASTYRVLAKDGTAWREIYTRNGRSDMTLEGVSADGTAVIAVGANESGRRVLWKIPLDGSGIKVLYENPDSDVGSVIADRFDGSTVGVSLGGLDQNVHWFDKQAEARFNTVARAFKDRQVWVYGRSADGRRVLARVESPSHPATYYLVDFNRRTADTVGDEYPALNDAALGEVRPIRYAARDGTSIPAYLTLPPNVEAKNLPLVVLPHGGPESQDEYGFGWWPQFLATRGYAVLQPQFRGSTGYGDAFRRAGYHQWGLLMQDDVTDGVRSLIQQGIANPRRVCIVGGSYGGYAALAGAAFTPDLYRCAISVNGVSDLPRMLGWAKEHFGDESDAVYYWKDSIGTVFEKNVIERSPVNAADRIQIPILLLHGVDDSTVPIAQSESMARELTKNHKTVTLVKLPGEDHWLSRGETRLRVLTEIEKFLAENL
jgi:dipeptidyl aminopeptidase/acylaminoacyl peptidase